MIVYLKMFSGKIVLAYKGPSFHDTVFIYFLSQFLIRGLSGMFPDRGIIYDIRLNCARGHLVLL